MASHSHRCIRTPTGYLCEWQVDYVFTPQARFMLAKSKSLAYRRMTDEAGARRFCKRWGIEMPEAGEMSDSDIPHSAFPLPHSE